MEKFLNGSSEAAREICLALGLVPEMTVSVQFTLEAGKLAEVRAVQHVVEEGAARFADVLRRYGLVEVVQDSASVRPRTWEDDLDDAHHAAMLHVWYLTTRAYEDLGFSAIASDRITEHMRTHRPRRWRA